MRVALREPLLVICRVKGINGNVRELSSILDFNSEYCTIFSRDALALGYSEASFRPKQWQKLHPDRAPYILDFRGIERSVLLTLSEVSIGRMAAKNVDAVLVELDIPRIVPFDMILGRSFLKNFKLSVDVANGSMTINQSLPPTVATAEE